MSIRLAQIIRIAAGSACLAGLGTFLYATQVECRRYQLETLSLTVGGGAMARVFRILHLSDLHFSHPESHKIDFLQKVTAQHYDLVVITGDIFENYTGLCYAGSLLASPARLGAYAVLGNHDYYNYSLFNKTMGRLDRRRRHPRQRRDVRPMVRALERAGIRVLFNEAVSDPGAGLHVVGIDYPTVDGELLGELVARAGPDQLKLVLFHLPLHLERISSSGAHLALGGHTHGGQIRLPGLGALTTDSELPRQESAGLIWRHGTAFHISRGLGADPRSNIRLFCPPAATVLEVRLLTS